MHSLLETYLSEVAARLGALPAKRRAEELREMRTHLENAVIVNREQGQTEDEAAQSAVAQFGTPLDLGENVVWAWRRGVSLNRRDFWGAAVCAASMLLLLTRLTLLSLSYLPPTPTRGFAQTPFSAENWLLWIVWLAPTFLLAGGISGLVFPRRAVIGAAFGLAMEFSYFFGGAMLNFLQVAHQPQETAEKMAENWFWLHMVVATDFVFVTVTAAAAWAGSRSRLTWERRGRLARGY